MQFLSFAVEAFHYQVENEMCSCICTYSFMKVLSV